MGGKMGAGSNIIRFPENPESMEKGRPRLDRLMAPPDSIAKIIAVPPKTISVHSAMRELARVLGDIDPMLYTRLGFHRKVRCSTYPEGVEFYDLKSRRAEPWAPGETLEQVDSWVRLWYFSVFETGSGILMGRYIDRDHPDVLDGMRLPSLEHQIRDPNSRQDGIEKFIARLRSR
jgi:hypothetical protein